MNSPPGILCAGGIVVDTIVRAVEELSWGTTTFVDTVETHLGGSAANTARALARLGNRVRLAGAVGNDEPTSFALGTLAKDGVDVSRLLHTALPIAATVVLVNARGDRQFLHRLGSSLEAFRDSPELTDALSEGIEHLHVASFFVLPHLRTRAAEMLRAARGRGLSTSLDTSWDPEGDWLRALEPCLPHVDVLFVNEDESRMLTGSADPLAAARSLQRCGARLVVQKLSGRGCAVYPPEGAGEIVFAAPFQVEAVDSTGAGDCFAAGFLSSYLRGASLERAAESGNAAGALSVRAVGSVAGLLSGPELDRWMEDTPRG